jgi:hypothetical protein
MRRAETLECSRRLLERRARSVRLKASQRSVMSMGATRKARIFREDRHTAVSSE